ncbi:monocyte chemotactic protein 1B-like [Poeciliopsis prolifica]|uniref:monocyte chemotactic protein 1B-like n=1 Tax=Poeciliopsis prolifica TaxID=188132 RepID=UPI0024138F5C|nr:monocyte chemotactic protein 1B-like [Poeciliopsis prolifica]
MARLALTAIVMMMAFIALTEGLRGIGPKKCCFRFNDKPVSQDKVLSYTRTSQRCSNRAILLNTVAGRQMCVRPSETWVKNLIIYLETREASGANTNL